MTTPSTSAFNVDTRTESSANDNPVSSSSTIPTNTVNVGTSNIVGRDHGIAPSVSFNDIPLGLLSANFSGRQKELAHMIKAFEAVRGDEPTRFGLYAGPGVGKSQLTLALAKELFDQGHYKCTFWIPATTVEKLYQGFSKLLQLVGHPDRSEPEEIRLTSIRRWLEDFTSGRWLLILDNVAWETVELLQEHLPCKNNLGNILFTTRTKDVATALAQTSSEQPEHKILELSIPDEEEAARLFIGHFREGELDGDKSKVQELVKCVGCLPIAIAQAASYMRQTGSTLDALLTILNSEHKIDMMEWENELSVYQENSVAATFTHQFDDLHQHFPDVSNLLKILAYFDPESIPLDVLITGASVLSKSQPQMLSDSVTPSPQITTSFTGKVEKKIIQSYDEGKEMSSLLALIQSPIGLPNAIAQLQNRSLTKQQGTGQLSSLWIHNLTQLIVLDNTKKGGAERQWFQNAVELACIAFGQIEDPKSPENWGRCEVLIPHIQSLTNRQGICGGANDSLLSANHRIAGYLKSRGRYNDAEVLYKQVLASQEKRLGPEHDDTLTTMNNLASVYDCQSRYSDAEALFKQVLSSREKKLGPEHVDTLATKHGLAGVYESQGRYNDAEVLFSQVLSCQEKQLGPEHVDILTTKHGMAVVYDSQGRYNDAEVLFLQVLSSREIQLGPEHVDTLATKHGLAGVYDSQGRHDDAEVLFMQALSSREKQLGSEHVSTLSTKHNLALVYNSQGRYRDAELVFKDVLSSEEKQLGPEHVNVLDTKHNLALVYNSQDRYSDAEELFRHVLSCEEKQLGSEHVNTLNTKHNLASLCNSQGRYAEAEALLTSVVAGRERWLGPSHPDTEDARDLLATVYTNQGRLDDAEKLD